MSDEDGLSRLLKRSKRGEIRARDVQTAEALMTRLEKFRKSRRDVASGAVRPLDVRVRNAQFKRGRPAGH